MGIKDLWSILTPFCERKPLYELQGKTVAVDLSCWICEAQNIAEYQIQPRMYLRNLYFRTCYLLLMEVNPVFVLEGKAPTLKYDTIAARNAIQFKGSAPKKDGVKTGKDRTRFHFTLRQCEQMLQYMGLACITGKGEAEAMCAYLNEDEMVSGCISQDSDCFAYGAKVVYRNFSISQQGAHAGSGGAVDIYDIRKAAEAIGFGRNKVIALALLVGSDYNDGVMGIGKDSAIKLFDKIPDEEILERLASWRDNNSLYDTFYRKISNKNLCTSCGHSGKIQSHTKSGCIECRTTKGCDFTKFKEERLDIKNELNMRSKALSYPDFPNQDLMNEFLVRKDNVASLNLKWKQPDMVNFVKFAAKYLTWEEIYSFEKLLPILTRWQLIHYKQYKGLEAETKGILYPDYIKKVRTPKGVPSYEIIWIDREKYFEGLIPEELLASVDLVKLWSTIEPQHLVESAFPELVEAYKQSKVKPKKPSKRKNKNAVDELGNLLANTSITEPKPKRKPRKPKTVEDHPKIEKKRGRKKKNVVEELQTSFTEMHLTETQTKPKTIDSYFKKALLNNMTNNIPETNDTQETYSVETIDHKQNTLSCSSSNCSFDLNASNFGDENDLDLSDIIENIINRDPLAYLKDELKGVEKDLLTKDGGIPNVQNANLNESSFFIMNVQENDLFEKTLDRPDSDSSDTEEYEFDELDLNSIQTKHAGEIEKTADCDFSFEDVYVPLLQRIQNK